jgi:hypothetical protein
MENQARRSILSAQYPANPKAVEIYSDFQDKYKLGTLGLWHALVIASMRIENAPECLSTLIIAPKGSLKSTMMNDFFTQNKDNYYMLESTFTPKKLVMKLMDPKINGKILLTNDGITLFSTKSPEQVQELMGVFNEALQDHRVGYDNLYTPGGMRAENVRVAYVCNIAIETLNIWFSKIVNATFLDRFVPFVYVYSREELICVMDQLRRRRKENKPAPKIEVAPGIVEIPDSINEEEKRLAEELSIDAGISYPRAIHHLDLILMSLAKLEGRAEVCESDLRIYEDLVAPYTALCLEGEADAKKIKTSGITSPVVVELITFMRRLGWSEFTPKFARTLVPDKYRDYPSHYLQQCIIQAKSAIDARDARFEKYRADREKERKAREKEEQEDSGPGA